MKNIQLKLALLTILIIGISSCSIEKRQYMSGYYFNFKNKNGNQPETTITAKKNHQKATFGKEEFSVPVTQSENIVPEMDDQVVVSNEKSVRKDNYSPLVSQNDQYGQNTTIREKSGESNAVVDQKKTKNAGGEPSKGLLFVLCFLIPWLAVGLATDWDVKMVVYNLLWSLTCIGGIIHALIVVSREVK